MKKSLKRALTLALAVMMIVPMITVFGLSANAANYQTALFFSPVLKVTNTASKHKVYPNYPYRLPVDFVNTNSANFYAPFDCKVLKIESSGNTVFFESTDKVQFANGECDYVTFLVCHDDDIKNIKVGNVYKQGSVFYQQGKAGEANGAHVHAEFAKGRFSTEGKNIWSFVRDKDRVRLPSDIMFITSDTKVVATGGYSWKIASSTATTTKPKFKDNVIFTTNKKDRVTANNIITSVRLNYKSNAGDKVVEFGIDYSTNGITWTTVDTDKAVEDKKAGGYYPDGQLFEFDFNKHNIKLSPNKTYYYRYYAKSVAGSILPSRIAHSTVHKFTTPSAASASAAWKDTVSLSNTTKTSEIKATTGKVRTKLSSVGSAAPKEVGVYFGTSKGKLSRIACDKNTSGWKNGQDFIYDLSKYYGKLKPNTIYYFYFYAKSEIGTNDSSKTVCSEVYSFTTPAR